MSRAVIYEPFGGPEVLEVRDVPEPHPGEGEIRVRVTAAGLNPMDWGISARPEAAARFGVTLPAGFGCDLAGVAGEVGTGVEGYAVGDRVYGGAMAKAVADFAIVPAALYRLMPTLDGISDEAAAAPHRGQQKTPYPPSSDAEGPAASHGPGQPARPRRPQPASGTGPYSSPSAARDRTATSAWATPTAGAGRGCRTNGPRRCSASGRPGCWARPQHCTSCGTVPSLTT